MLVGLLLLFFLVWFLQRTWWGRGLRAVSQDKDAAAVTGVNPLRMNTFAFAMGSMLAGMSGAVLIPIFAWVPWIGAESAVRAYVIVVLGGLGSVPGALAGGLIVGVVESLGSGCYPDPSRGAAYKEAFALGIFALMLLLRPNGLFGRKE
jgi:branched-chain amino acid transport system permease protein